MYAINRLFLFIFIAISGVGCTTFIGFTATPAPVASASVSPISAAGPQARLPAAALELPATRDIPEIDRAPAENSLRPSPSPDALFTALAALGIDYRYGGRSPATGFDCSGLVAHVYRDAFGITIPAQTGAQSRLGKPIELPHIETGDLVFYNTLGQPNTHVGIYIGDNRFIHAPRTGAAVRIESMRSTYWKTRFNGARRLVF